MKVKVINVPFGKIVIAEEEEGDSGTTGGLHEMIQKLASLLGVEDPVPEKFTNKHKPEEKRSCVNQPRDGHKASKKRSPTTLSTEEVAALLGRPVSSTYQYISDWNLHRGGCIITPRQKGKPGSGYTASAKEWKAFAEAYKKSK